MGGKQIYMKEYASTNVLRYFPSPLTPNSLLAIVTLLSLQMLQMNKRAIALLFDLIPRRLSVPCTIPPPKSEVEVYLSHQAIAKKKWYARWVIRVVRISRVSEAIMGSWGFCKERDGVYSGCCTVR